MFYLRYKWYAEINKNIKHICVKVKIYINLYYRNACDFFWIISQHYGSVGFNGCLFWQPLYCNLFLNHKPLSVTTKRSFILRFSGNPKPNGLEYLKEFCLISVRRKHILKIFLKFLKTCVSSVLHAVNVYKRRVLVMTAFVQSILNDLHITTSNEEKSLQHFLIILKRMLQNY